MTKPRVCDPQTDGNHTDPDSSTGAPAAGEIPDSSAKTQRDTELADGHDGDARPNPFDPARLRLSQYFAASLGVKKQLLTVPVRKPAKESWVQTHPDQSYRIQTAVLELKEDREIYLVDPELWSELATESTFSPRALFAAETLEHPVLQRLRGEK